jgi:HSP20 family molecular chaperone IbpA
MGYIINELKFDKERNACNQNLLNLLQILYERANENEQEEKNFYIIEGFFGTVCSSVTYPVDVQMRGEYPHSAILENGVLEVRFKKSSKEISGDIPIR